MYAVIPCYGNGDCVILSLSSYFRLPFALEIIYTSSSVSATEMHSLHGWLWVSHCSISFVSVLLADMHLICNKCLLYDTDETN